MGRSTVLSQLSDVVGRSIDRALERRGSRGLSGLTTDKGKVTPGGRADRHWDGGADVKLSKTTLGVEQIRDEPWLHDPQLALERFRLRSIEFGNWVKEEERRHYLYGAMQGLEDLARVLRVKPAQMGLGGKLSIALGARGSGGPNAHYDRDPYVAINLAKRSYVNEAFGVDQYKGRSALAHEFGHALDNFAPMLAGEFSKRAVNAWASGGDVTRHTSDPKRLKHEGLIGLAERILDGLYWQDDRETEFSIGLRDATEYYQRRLEVFARTFEAWISYRLDELGIRNAFLAKAPRRLARRLIFKGEPVRVYPSRAEISRVEPLLEEFVRRSFAAVGAVDVEPSAPAAVETKRPSTRPRKPAPPKPSPDPAAALAWLEEKIRELAPGAGATVTSAAVWTGSPGLAIADGLTVELARRGGDQLTNGRGSILFPDLDMQGHVVSVSVAQSGRRRGEITVNVRKPKKTPKETPTAPAGRKRETRSPKPEPPARSDLTFTPPDLAKRLTKLLSALANHLSDAQAWLAIADSDDERGRAVDAVERYRKARPNVDDALSDPKLVASTREELEARLRRMDRELEEVAGRLDGTSCSTCTSTSHAAAPVAGDESTVTTRTEDIPVRYEIRELDTLIPSHDPHTWSPRPDYPAGCQQRDYTHDKAEQAKVHRQLKEFKPHFLVANTPTAVDGPPIVTDAGVVLGGNSRVMTLQLLNPTEERIYREALERAVTSFGLSAEDVGRFRRPVLVRVARDVQMDRCASYSNLLNKGLTQELDITTETVSYARQLTENAVLEISETLAATEVDSMAEALASPTVAGKVVRTFEQLQIINDQNRSQWLDPKTAKLSDLGRLLIPKVLVGYLLPDKRLIDSVPAYTDRIVTAAPLILRMRRLGSEWDLMPQIEGSIRLESERRSSGMPRDVFVNQSSLDRAEIDERTPIVWDALERRGYGFKHFLEAYVGSAERERALSSEGFGFDTPMTSDEILRRLKHEKGLAGVDEDLPSADEWGAPATEDPAPPKRRLLPLSEVWKTRPTPFPWSPRFKPFFGNLGYAFRMVMWGPAGSGKSTLVLELAEELSRKGRVLYAALEESPEAGGFRNRMALTNARSSNVVLLDSPTLQDISEELATGQWKWIVLDSVNNLPGVTIKQVIQLAKQHPDIGWIFIVQSNADEKRMKGGTDLEHFADVVVTVKDGIASTNPRKNRFGVPANLNVFKR